MNRFIATTTLVVCLSLPLSAQLANTTALVGNVTDQGGAAMPGAAVTAVNEGTHDTYSALTNAEGYYNFQFVKIGTYSITAEEKGFQTVRKTGILVQTNQVVRADFRLQVSAVQQEVVVTGGVPPIATDDASLSEIINQTSTTDLPLNGRDPLQLAVTTPGVLPGLKTASGNPGGGEDFIGAGTREIQNSVSLDGVSIMNNLITTTTFRPSVDAVQEFQVQTGTYPAQYGGYMGVQMNVVTKNGTNDFHGAAWEFLRNDNLDARGFFENPNSPKSPFHQNQFGGEVCRTGADSETLQRARQDLLHDGLRGSAAVAEPGGAGHGADAADAGRGFLADFHAHPQPAGLRQSGFSGQPDSTVAALAAGHQRTGIYAAAESAGPPQ